MPGEIVTPPIGGQGAVVPAAAIPAVTPDTSSVAIPEASVHMTPSQLKTRLDEERAKARENAYKDLGFAKPEDAKAFLKTAKELQDSQLTEAQRVQKQLEELKPKAERADMLAKQFEELIGEQFAGLPEATQKAVDATAGGDATKRWEMIRMLRASGLLAPAAAAPAPAPAHVAPAAAPASKAALSPWEQYQALVQKGQPMAAALFRQLNASAIAASRPADK